MKKKVRGSLTIEMTMVLPFIMIILAFYIWAMVRIYGWHEQTTRFQAVNSLEDNSLYYPVIIYEGTAPEYDKTGSASIMEGAFKKINDDAVYIKMPSMSSVFRSISRDNAKKAIEGD